MKTTIDGAGRVVIPKSIRRQAGLDAGAEVDVELRDGVVEISPTVAPMRLRRSEAGATIEAEGELPVLTSDAVRDVLEHVRR